MRRSFADTPWLTTYVFLVLLCLPMDWFSPTGELLREFGAKPANPILTVGGLYGLFFIFPRRLRGMELRAALVFGILLILGICAALLNFGMGWSGWDYARNPLSQLIAQSSLIVAAGIAMVGNARLIRKYPVVELAQRLLPIVVAIHLLVFALEAAGILQSSSAFLILFRGEGGDEIGRPSGLTSEPAYFGTLAALYGTSLLFVPARLHVRVINWVMAISLYVGAVAISAKTFVVVVGAQAAFLVFRGQRTNLVKKMAATLALLLVMAGGYIFVDSLSGLDVEGNMSSAMRLGSTMLAANAASAGYGLTGIGIGQFHFFYRDEFAPNFLFLSFEAFSQADPDVPTRASTFNLYIRVLLEMGVAGFVVMIVSLVKLWRAQLAPAMTFIGVIFAGSLGFLMTQDTYFYPPLVLSGAAILAAMATRQPQELKLKSRSLTMKPAVDG